MSFLESHPPCLLRQGLSFVRADSQPGYLSVCTSPAVRSWVFSVTLDIFTQVLGILLRSSCLQGKHLSYSDTSSALRWVVLYQNYSIIIQRGGVWIALKTSSLTAYDLGQPSIKSMITKDPVALMSRSLDFQQKDHQPHHVTGDQQHNGKLYGRKGLLFTMMKRQSSTLSGSRCFPPSSSRCTLQNAELMP